MAAVIGDDAPFAARHHDLGDGFSMAPMSAADAAWAGAACAAMEPWFSYPFTEPALTAFFAARDEGSPRFVVREGAARVGALVVRRDWMRGPYVHMLVVVPTHQGRGLGRRLLTWVEGEACRVRERNLWIAVTQTNDGARRLYERFGFAVVGTLDGLVRDDRVELLMRKKLFV